MNSEVRFKMPECKTEEDMQQLFQNMRGVGRKKEAAKKPEDLSPVVSEDEDDSSPQSRREKFHGVLKEFKSMMRWSGGCGDVACDMLDSYRGYLTKLAEGQPDLQQVAKKLPDPRSTDPRSTDPRSTDPRSTDPSMPGQTKSAASAKKVEKVSRKIHETQPESEDMRDLNGVKINPQIAFKNRFDDLQDT